MKGSKILMVRWKGCKIRNIQSYLEGIYDLKYSKLAGNYEPLEIHEVLWKG